MKEMCKAGLISPLKSDRVIFKGDHGGMKGAREIFIDSNGNGYFNVGGGVLRKYDPKTNTVSDFPAKMPHGMVGRATQPDSNGVMYGATGWPIYGDQDLLFRFDPKAETIDTVTGLWSQTAAMSLDPTGRYVYYVASGKNGKYVPGLPIVQVDLQNGARQKVIAFLEDVMINDFGYKPYAWNALMSYSLMLSKDGRTIYVVYNSAPKNGKMVPSFLAIHIPEGEAEFTSQIDDGSNGVDDNNDSGNGSGNDDAGDGSSNNDDGL
jgi:hypothetical protein